MACCLHCHVFRHITNKKPFDGCTAIRRAFGTPAQFVFVDGGGGLAVRFARM